MRAILLVDDDEGMVETLADILEHRRYEVARARSGAEAIALVSVTRFDAVVMDIQMPGLNGVEALRLLRRAAPSTPAIMMTAFTQHELVQEARAWALEVVSKPLDVDHVLALIDSVTGVKRGATP